MSTEQTKALMEHHSALLAAEITDASLDELMADYHDDAMFISNLSGVATGHEAIRPMFAMAGAMPGFEQTSQHVEGDVGYVTWKAEGIAFGTDTFLLRDGKIAVQTVALHFA
jgi:ketosteroid isomerase-like protein